MGTWKCVEFQAHIDSTMLGPNIFEVVGVYARHPFGPGVKIHCRASLPLDKLIRVVSITRLCLFQIFARHRAWETS